jgi:signal transduction histidine kinase
MNLKLKFALLFSFLVSIILVASILVIYFLYSDTRSEDFNKRLRAEALQNYQLYYHVDSVDKQLFREIDHNSPANLFALQMVIIDPSNKIVYKYPDTLHFQVNSALLNKIRWSKEEYYFREGEREAVGIYISEREHQHDCYVITSAYDRYGYHKMEQFRFLIGLVILGGIVATGFCAFVFVRQVMRPLNRLNAQMQRITANNLKERVYLGRGNNELQQIAGSFNAMLERLEKSFELQKSFVHHASHELRTPLANMLAQTEAALSRNLDAGEARGVLQSLHEDQQELIELTNSLLLLSQYEKINHSSNWPRVRLDEVLYDTIAVVKQGFADANISVTFSNMPEHELALSIRGNDALLRPAFRNLIKNAYQYSNNKNVAITIEAGADHISSVHVENNGPTLTQAEQDRLFIPFFRGANAMGTKGFGLGLLIVRRIVVLHSGNITYSIPREGVNRFTLTFTKGGA